MCITLGDMELGAEHEIQGSNPQHEMQPSNYTHQLNLVSGRPGV